MSNILEQANKMVNQTTERSVLYGSFHQCNERIAQLMTLLCGKQITIQDVFYLEIAMKLAREIQNHKEENLLDVVAYFGALNNELENKNEQ